MITTVLIGETREEIIILYPPRKIGQNAVHMRQEREQPLLGPLS